MSNKPLRICLLGYRSAPFCGGQGIYIKYLSKALMQAGHQVDVISGEPYPELAKGVRLIKMPSLNLYASENHIRELRWQHLMSFTDTFEWAATASGGFPEPYTFGRRVYKYLKQHRHRYDLVHDNQSLCFGLLKLQNIGVPVVATIHHPITRDFQIALDAVPGIEGWGHRVLIRRWHSFLKMQTQVAKELDHVITVSELSRRDIAADFGRPESQTQLIYNGVDTEEFRPLTNIEKEPFRLITTASADQPLKGLGYLLDALYQLRGSFPQLQLQVIGKLKKGGATERKLEQLRLTDCVHFDSGISTEALVQHYNRASIAVAPSLYEGFGLPAAEAMACGTAIVSSSGGALPEVVGDAGLLVPAGDSIAMAEAIRSLLLNPERRAQLAKAGLERIEERFCWSRAAEQLTDYYQESVLGTQAQYANG